MAIKEECFFNQIFDPRSEFILRWNRLAFIVGVINFYVDPMFIYTPKFNESNSSIEMDLQLGAFLGIVRLVGDVFLMLRILVTFRTAYEASCSRVFRKRKLIQEPKKIAIKYLRSTFILDLLAALPLPEAYIWKQILASKNGVKKSLPKSDLEIYLNLHNMFWFQLFPRLYVVICSKLQITETTGILMKSGMSGAFYNLLWFMSFSSSLGAIYYFAHINWMSWCNHVAREKGLNFTTFDWDRALTTCTQGSEIGQGMMSSALENRIGTKSFIQKYMFCFSWGLKSLSSLGQNFNTSFSTSETSLSILITLVGLIFFADLITRMQLPKFENMDPELVEAICQHLRTFSGREGAYIVYEGDTVRQMLFIFSGELELSFADRGYSSVTVLGPGECCGQELVTWASQPATSLDNLPSSTWTIKSITDVEAFVLQAYDMKILATQFAHNQEFQRAFKQHYP